MHIQGGGFAIDSTNVKGNLQIQNHVCGATVNGNLPYQNSDAPLAIGAPQLKVIEVSVCPGDTVQGNLQVQNNTAATIFGNTVAGNLLVQNNNAAITASSNTVANEMQVQNNTVSSQVFNDVVKNNL